MPKKIFRTVGKVAGVVAGVALIGSGIGSVLGGTMVLSALGATVAAGTIATVAGAVSLGASLLTKPKATAMNDASLDRLNASLNPRAPRAMVFGRTAMATDLRDQEFTGTEKEFLHRFFVTAAHKANSIQEIWFDDQLAWTSTGGVQGEFVGYLQIAVRTEGSSANAINISSRMGNARRFTGCAYVHMRFKLTGNSKKTESPFAQQVPARMTIVGQGIPCYDPRQDSTVPGGSGPHRANNQSTWTWGAHARNPACQLATWMLGWRIQNPQTETWRLSVGKGIPADRIDWASFIEAANLCDEPVSLLSGGTEPRYRSDGIVTEADDPMHVVEAFKTCMNADLDDQDGLLRITVFHNDLATPDADFGDDDIEGAYTWIQTPSLAESFNVVRGGYIEPDDRSLYQQAEYDEARLPSPDGIDRIHNCDFALVQSKSQAERLAKQRLQRQQYGGTFRATFLASGWKVQKNSVVRLTCGSQGWTNKLFRVVETAVQFDGLVPMLLREEHTQIYAWDREEGPTPQIAEPTHYAPGEAPIPQFLGTIEEGATVGAPPGTPVGDRPAEDVISQLDQHQLDIAAADAAIEAADGHITDLLADMADAEASFLAIIADIGSIEGDIETLESTVSTQGAAISSLSTAVSGVETNYASLTQTVRVDRAGSLPSTFAEDGRFWFAGYTGDPATRTPISDGNPSWVSFATVSGVGRVLRMQGNGSNIRDVGQIGLIRWRPGMRLKAVARGRAVSGTHTGRIELAPLNADFGFMSGDIGAGQALGSDFATITVTQTADFPAGTAWVRARLRLPGPVSGQIEWVSLEFEDVTDVSNLGAQVTTQASALSALEGDYASLSSIVTSQGATISSNAAAIGTLQGNYASLTTQVVAVRGAEGNQHFDDGTIGWASSAANADARIALTHSSVAATWNGRSNVLYMATQRRDIFSWKKYPILPGRKYRIRTSLRVSSGPARQYVGVQCYGANGEPVGSNSGYQYMVLNSATINAHSSYFEYETVRDASEFNEGTASVRLIAWNNYDGNAPTRVAMDYFTIEDVTDAEDISASVATHSAAIATLDSMVASHTTTIDSHNASITTQGQTLSTLQTLNTITDTRNDNQPPSWYWANYPRRVVREFKTRTALSIPAGGTYGILTTSVPWSGSTGGPIQQTYTVENERTSYSRYSTGDSTWSSWTSYIRDLDTNVGSLQTSYASLSSDVSTMTVTVSQHATAIEQLGDDVDLALGSWGFNVTVGGRVSGMRHTATGNLAATIFETDRFGVVPPGGSGNGLYIENDAQDRTALRIRDGSVNVVELGWVP